MRRLARLAILMQVIFYEVASGNHYIAGELAEPEQIWIRGDLRGRTEEQKGKILRRILQGVAKSTDAPEEAVWVYLLDIPTTNIAEYGRILPLPGDENFWFEMLPESLKAEAASAGRQKLGAANIVLIPPRGRVRAHARVRGC